MRICLCDACSLNAMNNAAIIVMNAVAGHVKAALIEVLKDLVARHQIARAKVTEEVVDMFMAVRPMPGLFE